MGSFSDFFGAASLALLIVIATECRAESFDFATSFLAEDDSCSSSGSELSRTVDPRASTFSAIVDFGADIELEHAESICASVSGDARAEVLHRQLLDCRTKRRVFLQCRGYVLCRSENHTPYVARDCRSLSGGIDGEIVELTRALYNDGGKNWSIANLLLSALYFNKDLIPDGSGDALLRWMSSVDLSEPTTTRSLLIAVGIVLQRPQSLSDTEVQRFIAYSESFDGDGADRYIEPSGVDRLSNASLERIVLQLYFETLPDDWALPR